MFAKHNALKGLNMTAQGKRSVALGKGVHYHPFDSEGVVQLASEF